MVHKVHNKGRVERKTASGPSDAIFWKIAKKHPILGVWYTPMEKVLKAELCIKFVLNGYIL